MEELLEGSIKSVLRAINLVIRFLVWVVWEGLCEALAWYIGWPICRILTIGYFPKCSIHEHDKASLQTHLIVSLVGFIFLALIATLVVKTLSI